jgi:cell division septation protein DedD
MENRAPESGLELVLDNRKLIIAFVLLLAVCGCFFVLGFVEGKRQGTQEAVRNISPGSGAEKADTGAVAGTPEKKEIQEPAAKEQLDWYKNVGNKSTPPARSTEKHAVSLPQQAGAPPAVANAGKTAVSGKASYSVQVGVFKDRSRVEAVARRLKAKGYQYYIEPFDSGGFSLRVGRFDSRAEAVALSHRLKADGFPALIKAK